jgi:hypothetical protein
MIRYECYAGQQYNTQAGFLIYFRARMQIMRTLATFLLVLYSGLLPASPQAEFLTYLGGSQKDHPAGDMVIDNKGFIFITGPTKSANFPVTAGAFDTTFNDTSGNTDAYVMKLDPDGKIVWSTFIGSPTRDGFYSIKVDENGYVYLAGAFGPGAPTTRGALQPEFAGARDEDNVWDGYLVKLKPDGSGLEWATYLGTASSESLRSMDVDAEGNFVVATRYQGSPWPARWFSGSYQEKPQGGVDTVIIKVSADGKRVLWASYLGGSGDESKAPNVCLDKAGRVHVLTDTRSDDIPTTPGAHDRGNNGDTDIYLATLSPDGRKLLMGTILGSPEADGAGGKRGIQAAPDGNIIISGWTLSSRFPTTPGAVRSMPLDFAPWGATGITARFSPSGKLLASTYIGTSEGLSLDTAGNVSVAVKMWGDNLSPSADALQSEWRGGGDGALLVMSHELDRLLYATYLGGSADDAARITALGPDGSIHVSGHTTSPDLSTVHAFQEKYAGGIDVFLLKLRPIGSVNTGDTPGAVKAIRGAPPG